MLRIVFVFFSFSLISPLLAAQTHRPQQFLAKIQGTKDEGKQIVKHYCLSCHAKKPLIEVGAPKMADKKAWLARLEQGGLLQLFVQSAEGLGLMPPRGGCFECSDEQLKKAILALLPVDLAKEMTYKKTNR